MRILTLLTFCPLDLFLFLWGVPGSRNSWLDNTIRGGGGRCHIAAHISDQCKYCGQEIGATVGGVGGSFTLSAPLPLKHLKSYCCFAQGLFIERDGRKALLWKGYGLMTLWAALLCVTLPLQVSITLCAIPIRGIREFRMVRAHRNGQLALRGHVSSPSGQVSSSTDVHPP